MELNPENFLGKPFEELQNLLILKKYDLDFIKSNKNNPNLFYDAILINGNLNVLGIETKNSIFSFFGDECKVIKTFLNLDDTRKISVLLKDTSNSFRYFPKESSRDLDKKSDTEIKEGEFIQFEIKTREFENSIPFDVNNLENYEIISADLSNYRLIMNLKETLELKKKCYSVDIFKLENQIIL